MTDPTAPDEAGRRAWFQAQVAPIVDAEPVPDAWDAIEARVQGGVPAPVSIGRPRGRWLAAAAVIVVLAGLVVVGATRRSHTSTSVTADQQPATGFYVPTGLPEGWHLRTAWVSSPLSGCKESSRSWQAADEEPTPPRLELTYLPCGAPDVAADTRPGPALGSAVDSSGIVELDDAPDARLITWEDDGAWSLRSEGGLSEDELIAAASAIVADPASAAGPIPGMQISSTNLANGVAAGPTVSVSMTTPDGALATIHLAAPGKGAAPNPLTVDVRKQVTGQPLPVALRSPRWDGVDEILQGSRAFRRGTLYVGTWPGADVDVPRVEPISDGAADETVTQEERGAYDRSLIELVGALRPATASEWRTFLATATQAPAPRLLEADELTDLTGAGPSPAPPAVTSTVPTDPTGSGEPKARTWATSAPGTPVARAEVDERLTPLDDLELRLEMDLLGDSEEGAELRVGELAPARLVVHNTSNRPVVLTECTLALTAWGLVSADDPQGGLPGGREEDCAAFPEETVAPGATVRLPVDWRQPAGFVAQRPDDDVAERFLGPLPEGTYDATLVVPGRSSDVRLELEVGVPEPACPVPDAAIERYLGISRSAAQAVADGDGFTLNLATLDGEAAAPPTGVRCDRVNVDVWHGLVVNATVT